VRNRNSILAKMHQLAAILLAVVLVASAPGSARAIDNADASRIILLLVVKPPDANAEKGVRSWSQLFQNNVRDLLSDFSSAARRGIRVDVAIKDVEQTPQRDLLEASFGQQPSLQVLSTVGTSGGQSTLVDNEIYLGDFKGSLDNPYVHFSQRILPGEYEITREALAAVTLYAYAMAIAKTSPPGSSRFAVCQVLDRANMYRKSDLDPKVRGRLENLFSAISTELEAHACGGKK
jgi:hypothetical protein